MQSKPNGVKEPETHFHGDNMGSNPIGDTKSFQWLRVKLHLPNFSVGNAVVTIGRELSPLSAVSRSSGDSA